MSKKTELAYQQGKTATIEKLKKQITRDIEVLEEAFKISHENSDLAYHIDKQKAFANKYFGCCYKVGVENFDKTAFDEPASIKTDENNLLEQEQKEQKTADTSETTAFNEGQDETVVHKDYGFGWRKGFVDGKLQVIFDNSKYMAVRNLQGNDTLHTYETFINAPDPVEYLANIKIGDNIRFFDKKKGQEKTSYVINIIRTEMFGKPCSYVFVMSKLNGSISHKDFC